MSLLYLGLMSGTSLDGIDAALVNIDECDTGFDATLVSFLTVPYSEEQRSAIASALEPAATPQQLTRLNYQLGAWFAAAARSALDAAGMGGGSLKAIGSHGQTIWHEPPAAGVAGATLQMGEPAVIAETVGVQVISDFRARDVAAGGQGAPLVPLVDRLLFSHTKRDRALQNIGGIANVTFLPAAENVEKATPVVAFDTGPGVAVIDAVIELVSGGAESMDEDGARAAAARADGILLRRLLEDPYFEASPPKSTGRERFGSSYARALVESGRQLGIENDDVLIATATELTAASIADAYRRHSPPGLKPQECFVSGGGARNKTLMAMLAERLAPVPVLSLSALGWDPDAKEAVAFAVLAHLFICGKPGNLPSVTGASGPRILGKLTPA